MALFDLPLIVPISLSAALIYFISQLSKIGSRDPQLPPGPPTHPFIGNLAIIPTKHAYKKFIEWGKIYGGVFSLKVGSQTLIVVSSIEAANEILEKNAAVTADRAPFEPLRRCGPSGLIAFTPYGSSWKKMRRAATEVMKPTVRKENRQVVLAELSQMLFEIHEDPENMFYHIQRSSLSSVFAIVGGVRVPRSSSLLREKFFHIWEMMSEVLEPGHAPPVDLIPLLNYIPDRFARNWKARCSNIRQQIEEVVHIMVNGVEKRLSEGRHVGCHLELMLQNAGDWELERQDLLDTTAGLLLGGITTSAANLHWIVLLGAANPDAQQKLQEELDRVVGDERSPSMEDLPQLPYLNAFVKEVHRLRTIAIITPPHRAQEDIWYQGKLIPKGSQIVLNAWDVLHKPEYYDNPDSFDPDRFIRSPYGTKPGLENRISVDALKKMELVPFGWGKRRCVGMPMANESSALGTAHLFWAFEFRGEVDKNGVEIKPDIDRCAQKLGNDPLPFKCKITPRSSRRVEVIKHNYTQSTPVLEQFETELSKEDRVHVEGVRNKLQGL